jgi:hypothetical protein
MKDLFKAIFRITTFQVAVITFFSLLKYVIIKYNYSEVLRQPMIFILLGFGLVFIFSVGMYGLIENKQDPSELERTRQKFAKLEKRFSGLLNLGIGVPALFAAVLFFYIVIPTTIQMVVFFLIGIFLGNLVEYFKKKSASPEEI